MELIAGDGRVFLFPQLADPADDPADLVMPLYRRSQLLLAEIHAVDAAQGLDDLLFDLPPEVTRVPVGLFQGHVNAADEKPLLGDELAIFEILLGAVHGGAALLAQQRVNKIVAALKGPLQNTLGIGAGAVGHIICSKVGTGAARSPEPDAEAAFHIQQNFRDIGAVVGKSQLALGAGLLNKGVVRILQKILKKDQVL